MTSLFERAADLFHAALALEPSQRERFLEGACAGEPALRAEVASLLAAHGKAGSFLETPVAVASTAAPSPVDATADLAGRRVGAYRVEAEVGRGGMGIVYRARRDDDAFQRLVAVKLVRPGQDGGLTLRRFQAERRILANLDHPNIARLLDGGTTGDGQPYFVMEYVEGVPLDVFCRANRLGVRERVRLFRTVCEAVHHAHQSLVVHRDLKPSNILVTATGVPKLLDFGIAKVLEPDAGAATAMTMTGWPMMTPAYASPEQARGDPITTATDVHALGLILCEVLTGRLPYSIDRLPASEVLRIISEGEPQLPSRLVPPERRTALAGDLDNIVHMAVRKEPSRRYASASQLAEDLTRYLEGQPVLARKDTLRYRAVKFVRRNRLAVGTGALAILGLVVGVVLASWQAHVAERHRATAERRFRDLRQVATFFINEFHDKIRDLPGSTPARALLVKRMLAYLDSLAGEAVHDRKLQREVATGYHRLGDVQGNTYGQSLGDSAGARRSYEKAEALRAALVRASPGDQELRRELARSRERLGDLRWVSGDYQGAVARYRQALRQREALARSRPLDPTALAELRETLAAIGDLLLSLGDTGGALVRYRRAMAVSERLRALSPQTASSGRAVAVSGLKLGFALARWGDAAGAVRRLRGALRWFEAYRARHPRSAKARYQLHIAHQYLGVALLKEGRFEEALDAERRSLALAEEMVARDPRDAVARRGRLAGVFQVAEVLLERGDRAGALAGYQRAVKLARAEAAADPGSAQARRDLGTALLGLGRALTLAGRPGKARDTLREAITLSERSGRGRTPGPEARADLAGMREALGRAILAAGEATAALSPLMASAAERERLSVADPENADLRSGLGRVTAALGDAWAAVAANLGAPGTRRDQAVREARAWYRRSAGVWSALRRGGRLRGADARSATHADAGLRRLESTRMSQRP